MTRHGEVYGGSALTEETRFNMIYCANSNFIFVDIYGVHGSVMYNARETILNFAGRDD